MATKPAELEGEAFDAWTEAHRDVMAGGGYDLSAGEDAAQRRRKRRA